MKIGRLIAAGSFLLGMLVAAAGPAQANSIYTVTMDTSSISGGSYFLAFQLTDGSGGGDGNNIVTLGNFNFGSGSASGSPTLFGGASGNLGGTVTLQDTAFLNLFSEGFTPGNNLSFVVDLTTNADVDGTPDAFAFSIIDSTGMLVPTEDPTGTDTLFSITDMTNPLPDAYGTGTMRAPAITPGPAPVPEPESLLLMLAGMATLFMFRFRQIHGRK